MNQGLPPSDNQLSFNKSFSEDDTFADIVIPIAVPLTFTYRIGYGQNVVKGARVLIPFGKRKIVTGIVLEVHNNPPEKHTAKVIQEVLDEQAIVNNHQMALLKWISDYYICTLGEAYNIALPGALKLNSESFLHLNPGYTYEDIIELLQGDIELEIVNYLKENPNCKLAELAADLPHIATEKYIKQLLAKRVLIFFEQISKKYTVKTRKIIYLNLRFQKDIDALAEVLEQLGKAPKQQEILVEILDAILLPDGSYNWARKFPKTDITKKFSEAPLRELVKKQILIEEQEAVSRLHWNVQTQWQNTIIQLSDAQAKAQQEIIEGFSTSDAVLLHGVTGAGKTEIYISLIQQALLSGGQVLLLLPEIALTTQIVTRIGKVFGAEMGVYHSKMSDAERAEVYFNVLQGSINLIVGVRSALFLPFANISLIIIDEEHEPSYKQQDPAPRYHGRDLAIVVGRMHKAAILLGSATPSLESYYQTEIKKWKLVELFTRFGDAQVPQIEISDIRKAREQKTLKANLAPTLFNAIEETKRVGNQTLLFQNRRGYSPYITCDICNWIPKCINCDVSLTQHLKIGKMRCHYCGYEENAPGACPTCGNAPLRSVGFGTERIEEELLIHLPNYSIARMDLDTTRAKHAVDRIIQEMDAGATDILVGTQMLTKGFDFEKVSLVGVFDVDRMIYQPDFRASERCYQLVTQVAGRAGRRKEKGRVIVQTSNPEHPLLQYIIEGDYRKFFQAELNEREKFHYPPFTRLILITFKHADRNIVANAANSFADILQNSLGSIPVLGPEAPLIERLRNIYYLQIIVKLDTNSVNLRLVKNTIKQVMQEFLSKIEYRKLQIIPNVDPV